jgi:phthalate 4,5-dioxygenase
VQRHESFTGIEGLEIQDIAITESMGPVVDHHMEHLAPSDVMVTRTRRRLTRAAQDLADKGIRPPGAANPDAYATAWGGFVNAPADKDWLQVFKESIPSGKARVVGDT